MNRLMVRIRALAMKETLHIIRDPRTIYMGLGMPVVMLLLFGFGISYEVHNIPYVVVDQSHSVASRNFIRDFGASGELKQVGTLSSPVDAYAQFEDGKARAALVVPYDFEKTIQRRENARVQFLVDAADGSTASQTLSKGDAIAKVAGAKMMFGPARAVAPPIVVDALMFFNPDNKSAIFLVPGISAYVLSIVAVLLTALTIAREWEQGSMEQLFATPVGRVEIIIGKLLPYMVLGSLAVLLTLTLGMWVFDVPMRGDPLTLGLAFLLFLLGMLGQGLLISIVTRNQNVATQASSMASMLPALLLSGFIFPIDNMPIILQGLSYIIPARYMIDVLRGVLLRGNGIADLWPNVLALAVFAALMITVSIARFQRRLA